MIRLNIVVEGQTEERFAKTVLAPYLSEYDVFVAPRCVLTSKDGPTFFRGGMTRYSRARKDIANWIKQESSHSEVWFSTMFDLYALPMDFPGFDESRKKADPYGRVAVLETALACDIDCYRFVPYIQLHEFEALILADPSKLNHQFLEHDRSIDNLVRLAVDRNPELIDDGPQTAPSKRIIEEIPEYEDRKASAGPIVAEKIGLPALRERCRHFDQWISRLEALAQ